MVGEQSANHVSARRIGDADVAIISEGTLFWAPRLQAPEEQWRRAMPEADAEGRIASGLNVAVIRRGDAVVVVDPGYTDPAPDGRGEASNFTRSAGLRTGMDQLGIRPEQVTHVVITHPHGDHIGGVTVERAGRLEPRFPNARYLLGRADWDTPPPHPWTSPLDQRLEAVNRLGRLDLLDGDQEIAPGVAVLRAPGETPGHQIVRLRAADATFYYLGDLFHHPCEFTHLDWVSPGRDREAALASRRRLLAEAVASDAVLVYTHEAFPPWGRAVATADGYGWQRLE